MTAVTVEQRAARVTWDRKAVSEGVLEGYASVFDVVDDYLDVVRPGAFTRTIEEAMRSGVWPAMLWSHDPTAPIGVWSEMREDARGLFVRGQLAPTQQAQDVRALVSLGAVTGLSIGYRTRQATVDPMTQRRELVDVDLVEVSVVTFPAARQARVTHVKAATWTEREWEAYLREVMGLSHKQARLVVARGIRALRRDVADDATEQQMIARMREVMGVLR